MAQSQSKSSKSRQVWRVVAYLVWCAIAATLPLVPQPTTRLTRLTMQAPETATAIVTRVASGQTIEVNLNNRIETVRLVGIDAPDLRQSPWGLESQQTLANWIEGQSVTLMLDRVNGEPERDRFDRLRGSAWIGGELVQAKLLRSGQALVWEADGGTAYLPELRHAEAEARVLDRGIWSLALPLRQHPIEFRSER